MAGTFRYNLGADYDASGDGDITDFGGTAFSTMATAAAMVGAVLPGDPNIYFSAGSGMFFNGFSTGTVPLLRHSGGYLFDLSATGNLAKFVGGDFGDILRGGNVSDDLRGGGGNDRLNGNFGSDYLDGGAGNDIIDGGQNGDLIEGRDGNDDLTGGLGDDEIDGGFGNDRLIGNAGIDVLFGGYGKDNFIFVAPTDSGTTSLTRDIVNDFTKGQDIITLSPIDANAATGVNEAFVLLAKGVSNTPVGTGQISFFWQDFAGTDDDKTILRLNTDADADIEMTIQVYGHVNFTASDFVL